MLNKKKISLIVAGILAAIICLFIFWPLPSGLSARTDLAPIRVTDRDGKLLYEARKADYGLTDYLSFKDIPDNIKKIAIAVEDRSFYSNPGVSLRGILRAAWQNFKADKIVSGGSTITQQLVRIRLKPEHRGYLYKVKEMLLALRLDAKMSKDEILEAYLNEAYFGHQAYGVQAAARTYFGKNVAELSLAESSLLIGLIKSPVGYDPFTDFDLAKERQKVVFTMLRDTDDFSVEAIDEAETEPIHLASGKVDILAPHFVMWILNGLKDESGDGLRDELGDGLKDGSEDESMDELGDKSNNTSNYSSNYSSNNSPSIVQQSEIRTTLDLSLQSEIELIVKNQVKKLEDKNVTSAAVVVLDAHTGEVLAMVGSADYFDVENDGAVNVALSSRQPGSALKPFTYALAFEKGDTAASTVADIETQFFTQEGNPYVPRNYDYGYHGLVRYRESLANSYNIAAVKVLEKVGIENLLFFLRDVGLNTLTEDADYYGLALTLGDAEVKLLDLAKAYAIFPRGGKTLNLKVLTDETPVEGKQVIDKKTAWLVTDILSDNRARVAEFGENSPLNFSFPVAAKTGTTRNSRDNWTIGFTPDRIVGVWVGNADNTPMKNTSGVTGAGPIFHDVMLAAVANLPRKDFERPEGFVQKEICALSGKLPTPECENVTQEWFIQGTEPKEKDDIFQKFLIDKRNGLQAGEACQSQYVEEKVIAVFPPELKKWARENGWPEVPMGYSPLCEGADEKTGDNWIIIDKPSDLESFLLDPMIPDENEKIIFEAEAGTDIKEVEWSVNGKVVGTAVAPHFRLEWEPESGKFKVSAKGEGVEESVDIEVLK
jgi:penicillin-binding protein 1C